MERLPDDDFGRIVRLLMLTGQRRDEVSSMGSDEFDLNRRLRTIPRSRTKNGIETTSSALRSRKAQLPDVRADRFFVFGQGEGGFSGWSKAKEKLDKRIVEAGEKVRPWRLHDLRRTTQPEWLRSSGCCHM